MAFHTTTMLLSCFRQLFKGLGLEIWTWIHVCQLDAHLGFYEEMGRYVKTFESMRRIWTLQTFDWQFVGFVAKVSRWLHFFGRSKLCPSNCHLTKLKLLELIVASILHVKKSPFPAGHLLKFTWTLLKKRQVTEKSKSRPEFLLSVSHYRISLSIHRLKWFGFEAMNRRAFASMENANVMKVLVAKCVKWRWWRLGGLESNQLRSTVFGKLKRFETDFSKKTWWTDMK